MTRHWTAAPAVRRSRSTAGGSSASAVLGQQRRGKLGVHGQYLCAQLAQALLRRARLIRRLDCAAHRRGRCRRCSCGATVSCLHRCSSSLSRPVWLRGRVQERSPLPEAVSRSLDRLDLQLVHPRADCVPRCTRSLRGRSTSAARRRLNRRAAEASIAVVRARGRFTIQASARVAMSLCAAKEFRAGAVKGLRVTSAWIHRFSTVRR
jgi:hypothetical protein